MGGESSSALIPGLPEEVAEMCLVRVPYPYRSVLGSVSWSWRKAVREGVVWSSQVVPYLFVMGVERGTCRVQWQALDPVSGRWFVLPPMPCPAHAYPPAFACASVPRRGLLFVLGGMDTHTNTPMDTTLVYSASTNRWSVGAPMPRSRAFFGAEYVGGRIVAVGGSRAVGAVDRYDPERGEWEEGAEVRVALPRYHTAALGDAMLVAEGGRPPFMRRGGVYEGGAWREMRGGMREGWAGVALVLGGALFCLEEDRLKVYVAEEDAWEGVGGDTFPRARMEGELVATEVEGSIYVVSTGMHVAVGRVYTSSPNPKEWTVTWQLIIDSQHTSFPHLYPSSSHVLYA